MGALVELIAKMITPGHGNLAPGLGLLFMYGFAFQIYCDFAAYSTIARGSAKLFNVDLMRNFLTPYLATNPSEFWQRWHISLSTWLRDYLYIPLGGSQHGRLLTMRNLMITMFLGGLWHGAGFFFILWGLYHGLLLVLYRLVPIDGYLIRLLGQRLGRAAAILVFFHLVCIGWIFFRATPEQFMPIWNSILALPGSVAAHIGGYWQSLGDGANFIQSIRKMVTLWVTSNWPLMVYGWGLLLFGLPVVIMDIIAWRRNVEFPDLYCKMPTWLKVVMIILLLYAIQFFGRRESNEFIYFAF